jgi:hypothetical protein
MNYVKYPRTFHLPWSKGLTTDDKKVESLSNFIGKRVIVSEKIDGECSSLYSDHLHARSIDSKHHPSRNWIKQFHSERKHDIPETYRICGENVYAMHSIFYDKLPSYFLAFSIWEEDICKSWDETKELALLLDMQTVPILYDGIWDEEKIKACWTGLSKFGSTQEGYVVRLADSFKLNEFANSVVKYVRENHVQTDEHWINIPVKPNLLTEP